MTKDVWTRISERWDKFDNALERTPHTLARIAHVLEFLAILWVLLAAHSCGPRKEYRDPPTRQPTEVPLIRVHSNWR